MNKHSIITAIAILCHLPMQFSGFDFDKMMNVEDLSYD